jgi:Bacterial Ig domain
MRMRTLLASLVAALACAAAAAPAQAVETGVNEMLHQRVPTGKKASALRADWVRLWAGWDALEERRGVLSEHNVAPLRAHVTDLKARGIKVLMIVHLSPSWASGGQGGAAPPSDPATFGSFMGRIAAAIPGVDAWELWNEPDSPAFFAGGPDPAKYAAMLRAAYPAIKAAQPADTVVSGGMVANNMDFVSALYDHGAQGSFDAVGVHTDTACLTNGPDVYYRDERGRVGRYTFTGYREVHQVMADHGDGAKPIWLTEIGWSTQSTRPGSCNVGMWKGKKRLGVSRKRQARFLRAAYRCAAADPYVGVALWFGMQDFRVGGAVSGHGLYTRRGKAKRAVRAFKRLDRGIRPRRGCGGYVDRTPPSLTVAEPVNGQRFRDKVSVRVRAQDNRGGSGIGRISMALDGAHVTSWARSGRIEPWWASADWPPGPHTLTFTVRDYAQNQASVSVTVQKLRR